MVGDRLYTAVIRTLGTAGYKYQNLLDSLNIQTMKPSKIVVYIAEGYDIPPQTIGKEQYVFVKKGMVAQRALLYGEVDTEYILFLDDDLSFPPDTVERMFYLLQEHQADVISPDIFPNSDRPLLSELMMTLSGRMRARRGDQEWGYKVMANAGYSYNASPKEEVYRSQTNAGACFLCSKENFLKIHFEDERWMDGQEYAIGDDQVMFYKMYLSGLKILTWYTHGFQHLDGGDNFNLQKKKRLITADFWFKTIFWHRFIFLPEKRIGTRIWSICCLGYTIAFALLVSFLKGDVDIMRLKYRAMRWAVCFIKSETYQKIPKIKRQIK